MHVFFFSHIGLLVTNGTSIGKELESIWYYQLIQVSTAYSIFTPMSVYSVGPWTCFIKKLFCIWLIILVLAQTFCNFLYTHMPYIQFLNYSNPSLEESRNPTYRNMIQLTRCYQHCLARFRGASNHLQNGKQNLGGDTIHWDQRDWCCLISHPYEKRMLTTYVQGSLLLTWVEFNPNMYKSILKGGMKLLIHPQTSTVQLLKFGNEQVISSHTLLGMWKVMHAGIKWNHVSKSVYSNSN